MKKLQISLIKMLVNTIGRTSDGIKLATEHGFTSGKMLDYIYQNRPSGSFGVGVLVDTIFIRHKGWEVIRKRKANLVKLLTEAISLTLDKKGSASICDVASGPAVYIMESVAPFKDRDIFVELHDIDGRWLEEAAEKAKELSFKNIDFKVADALNADDFKFEKNPDIFVSSGFYDWFDDDEKLKLSMKLIYDALPAGGYFVSTNQTGHIDLELTNGVFHDFNNSALNMTVRNAEEVKSWAEEIGFDIVDTACDSRGHYLVMLVRK